MTKLQMLQYINAWAITSDQLLNYVSSVSGVQSELMGNYVVHRQYDNIIMIGYNLENPHSVEQLDIIIEQLVMEQNVKTFTVLAPIRPNIAPKEAISSEEDAYWFLDLPISKLNFKVKNMIVKANDKINIIKTNGKGAWTTEHQELMLSYIKTKIMDSALCSILQGLGKYLITSPQVELFSAYDKNNKLMACALADFSSFNTSFYMFAFRKKNSFPGVSDAILYAILNEASARGYVKCNLGLGINDGIRFFKQKWGAKPILPFVQTKWEIKNTKKTWFSRFFD